MVSRSLEKMMLIAVGLTTAVIIGVPVLLYAIDTMTTTQQIQYAQEAANSIFNATGQVDNGELEDITIQVYIPSTLSIMTDESGNGLVITLDTGRPAPEQYMMWSQTFDHQLVIDFPDEAGTYHLRIHLVSGVIQMTFARISV